MAKAPPAPDLAPDDEVYVRHPIRGVSIVRVLASGRDGFQGTDEDGTRVKVHHTELLGHKTRMLHTYNLVDEGADGVLVERGDGQRRFLRGELPKESENSGPAKLTADDPLLSGLDELLGKALRPLSEPAAWLLKAVAPPETANKPSRQAINRPKSRQDHADKPKGKPLHKHGDVVRFRHGDVEGKGEIVASGADGVTIKDDTGREHQVRHDALLPPDDADKKERAASDASDTAADKPIAPKKARTARKSTKPKESP